ncbi:MAG: fibronectin type III domain-containing protein [Patescibacteria group bacterium]|nr:fibronectin type III domain-containing protein [Patescibacteria group bacterium]
MKKILVIVLVCAFVFSVSLVSEISASTADSLPAGTVIKGEGLSTLYYIGEDGKRYVFPNSNIFFSWYDDFSEVVEVSLETLYEYPLGGNARYKPGALLVKIQTDPKVYAVGHNGKLHWIKTEPIARALYGNNWNKLVDDVPDSFFTNYEVGGEVDGEDDFDPTSTEEETPSISHNRGFKAKVAARIKNRNERICDQLDSAVNRLQKRLVRWEIALPDIGKNLMKICYGLGSDGKMTGNALRSVKKATLCHEGKTISVDLSAIGAHLKQGGFMGACEDDSAEPDTTAPKITDDPHVATSSRTAVITWTTDELSDSKVIYAEGSFETASPNEATSTDLVLEHSVELINLSVSTTYSYKVESKDAAGNLATSSEATFVIE